MRHDHEAGGSITPLQGKTPIIQSVVVKLTDEVVRLELEGRLKALEAAVKRNQGVLEERQEAEEPVKRGLGRVAQRVSWPPRDDEEVLTPSSAEVEAEGKEL